MDFATKHATFLTACYVPCVPFHLPPAGFTFSATTPGRRGLTALHLSSLVADGGDIASLLSEKCPGEEPWLVWPVVCANCGQLWPIVWLPALRGVGHGAWLLLTPSYPASASHCVLPSSAPY